MMMAMRIIRVLLVAALAAWVTAGCEFSSVENLGDVSLNDLQGIQAAPPAPAPGDDDGDDGGSPSPPISGGEGIGPVGGGGGFLWKPVSESTGRLVVLLPPQYTGRVSSQHVADSGGTVMDQGLFTGIYNGGREHFRYSKPGAGYGNNVYAVAVLKDGNTVSWLVPVGSQRTQY
jgi:hypothetical protein